MRREHLTAEKKTLWELLWDYDPNGLLVVDTDLKITLVNSALCAMFKTTAEAIVGRPVSVIIDDAEDFLTVWRENQPVKAREALSRVRPLRPQSDVSDPR